MKKTIILTTVVLIAGVAGFWLGTGYRPSEESGAEREVAYWRAPMNPDEIYDRPGKSAMGMDLVPVYADELADSAAPTTRRAFTQRMNVRTTKAGRMDLSRTIRTVGEVAYDEERLHAISSKISGWIEVLNVNYVGDQVRAGDPLAELYAPDLVATQNEFLLALKNVEVLREVNSASVRSDAEQLLDAARDRLVFWDVQQADIDRLASTGQVRRTIELIAPASGVVVNHNVLSGSFVDAGVTLLEIADLRQVWVHVSVFDHELSWIRVGQESRMTLSYQPGREYLGRVSYIYPFLRDEARDAHVRLVFDNPNLELVPGMYVNVELDGETVADVLAVPISAVLRSGTRDVAFVAHGDGRFEPRTVRLGAEGGPGNEFVQVLSGIEEGEWIVISGQFMLSSESRLQEALESMAPDSVIGHNH
ncbi:MAG: efflux RND transporter periplasmic adaptor subunit [Bacteroidota bacterium]|nr:efflux RND transporter periplasmic adaptor subunit [Bacteroidota bacterium]